MDIKVPRGKYVLAVSGGVDSMTLLDLLANRPGIDLIVAHFNHGIRPDGNLDEKIVIDAAKHYGLPIELGYGRLGPKTSEDTGRQARYAFLQSVRLKTKSSRIITAHHQDDLIETALINSLRGTGRHGLTAIMDNKAILRPLLRVPKSQIRAYAQTKNLSWREDETNSDTRLLRNYLRHNILPKISLKNRQQLLARLEKTAQINAQIDLELAALSPQVEHRDEINRQLFSLLPTKVADELLAYWLKTKQTGEIDKYQISRLSLALKTAKPLSVHPVKGAAKLAVNSRTAAFITTP